MQFTMKQSLCAVLLLCSVVPMVRVCCIIDTATDKSPAHKQDQICKAHAGLQGMLALPLNEWLQKCARGPCIS